jgi:hypothetical protein
MDLKGLQRTWILDGFSAQDFGWFFMNFGWIFMDFGWFLRTWIQGWFFMNFGWFFSDFGSIFMDSWMVSSDMDSRMVFKDFGCLAFSRIFNELLTYNSNRKASFCNLKIRVF